MMKNSTYFCGGFLQEKSVQRHSKKTRYNVNLQGNIKVILYRVIECISFLFLLFLLLYHRIDFLDLIPTFIIFFHF